MKIVFVIPSYDYSASVGNRRKKVQIGLLPPLGVGYLAAALEAEGHSVALVDAVAEQLDVAETAEAVAALEPDVVGLSSFTTYTPNSAYAAANAIRARLPETPMVMGGPHVTSFAKTILQECPAVDVLVPGDGEIPFTQLVQCLAGKQPDKGLQPLVLDGLRGILYRAASGETVATPPADFVKNIDQFRHPARHIYKHHLYVPLPSLSMRRPATAMITARGCPWAKCLFCYQGGEYATPYRRRSPENVVDEIGRLVKDWGICNIVFWDDNFCVMPGWIDSFCSLLEKEKHDVIWSILSRVNTVTPDLLRRMKSAGCYSIQYGVESGSQPMLDLVHKGHTLDQCRQAVKWAKKAGMDTRAFFVLGFPTETPEMADQTIRFACELNVDYAIFFSYHIAPGTPLADLAAKEGTLGAYEGQHLPSYVPNTYGTSQHLGETVKKAYRRYYFRPRYIARALWRVVKKPAVLKNHFAGFYYWLGLMLRRNG